MNMKPPKWFWVFIAATLLLFMAYVWPSIWYFPDGGEGFIRINRFTGTQQRSGEEGWH